MPSRAVYTGLALARSDTGGSRILMPSVEESVMVTPEVVGHIDPGCRSPRHFSHGFATGASSFLIGPVRRAGQSARDTLPAVPGRRGPIWACRPPFPQQTQTRPFF